ncbi:MAG: pyridoxamine 5'-phosphate oxidase family protein [Clostridia bacterium]|nr:pyridoxamine 5'-phosphate oxidase family protein [Clostridia bacterium]
MTRRELEVKEPEKIVRILEECKVLHLGLVDDGLPYIVPMNYGFTMEEGRLTLYIHSAAKGYKLDVIRKNPVCAVEMECEVEPFEGVLPCQYGTSYYSLMGRGRATIVEDTEEKIRAMAILMKTQTGKDFVFNERLVSIVSVIRIDVSEYTAKHRATPAEKAAMSQ